MYSVGQMNKAQDAIVGLQPKLFTFASQSDMPDPKQSWTPVQLMQALGKIRSYGTLTPVDNADHVDLNVSNGQDYYVFGNYTVDSETVRQADGSTSSVDMVRYTPIEVQCGVGDSYSFDSTSSMNFVPPILATVPRSLNNAPVWAPPQKGLRYKFKYDQVVKLSGFLVEVNSPTNIPSPELWYLDKSDDTWKQLSTFDGTPGTRMVFGHDTVETDEYEVRFVNINGVFTLTRAVPVIKLSDWDVDALANTWSPTHGLVTVDPSVFVSNPNIPMFASNCGDVFSEAGLMFDWDSPLAYPNQDQYVGFLSGRFSFGELIEPPAAPEGA